MTTKFLSWILSMTLFIKSISSTRPCRGPQLIDLQIIVDPMEGIGKAAFDDLMAGIADKVLVGLDVRPQRARVGFFKYSSLFGEIIVEAFSLTEFSQLQPMQSRIKQTTYNPGKKMTAEALMNTYSLYNLQARKEGNTAKLGLLFTDGKLVNRRGLKKARHKWKEIGADFFVIGVGANVDRRGLNAIAGKKNVFVGNLDGVREIVKESLQKSCRKDKGPHRFCFKFPKSKPAAKVLISPLRSSPLFAFTVDMLYALRADHGDPWILSYSSNAPADAFRVGPKKGARISTGNSSSNEIDLPTKTKTLTRLTLTWNGVTGTHWVYVDGKPVRNVTLASSVIGSGGVFTMGGVRNSLGSTGDERERFVGRVCDFQMWDRVLSRRELNRLFAGRNLARGNIFDVPPSYKYEVKGGAKTNVMKWQWIKYLNNLKKTKH